MAHKQHRNSGEFFVVIVRLLEDDNLDEVNVPDDATGKWLFEEVCRRQEVMQEREYFGLRYIEHELLSPPTKQWLDLTRSVVAQLKHAQPHQVSFRIKHYPGDPLTDFRLPKSHFLLYHQLRRDLSSGRLIASPDKLVRLAALVVQVELGDRSMQDPSQLSETNEREVSYLNNIRVLHNQSQRTESLILEEHKKLEGTLPYEAASELIFLASSLETYGIDPVRVRTKAFGSRPIHLGLTHQGIAEFVSSRREKMYPWSTINTMTYDGKYFIVTLKPQSTGKKKHAESSVRFKCESKSVARALWEWASDRQLFLTLEKSFSVKPVKSKKRLFSRTHTFTFSGRCRREVLSRPTLAASMPTGISSTDTLPISHQAILSCHSLMNTSLIGQTPTRSLGAVNESGDDQESGPDFNVASSSVPSVPSTDTFCEQIDVEKSSMNKELTDSKVINIKALDSTKTNMPYVNAAQLAPYFINFPKNKYIPEAVLRHRKLLHQQYRGGLSQHEIADIFDTDEDEQLRSESTEQDNTSQAAVDAVNSAAEAGAQLLANDQQVIEASPPTSSSTRQWFNFFKRPSSGSAESQSDLRISCTPEQDTVFVGTEMTTELTQCIHQEKNKMEDQEELEVEEEKEAKKGNDFKFNSAWHVTIATLGLVTGVSLIGLALLLEAEIRSPFVTALRGHPWLLDFDARYYRPLRSALLNLWRR